MFNSYIKWLFQVLHHVPHQQGRDWVHRPGDLRLGHVPKKVLGLFPSRRLLQEAIWERTWGRRRRIILKSEIKTKARSMTKHFSSKSMSCWNRKQFLSVYNWHTTKPVSISYLIFAAKVLCEKSLCRLVEIDRGNKNEK